MTTLFFLSQFFTATAIGAAIAQPLQPIDNWWKPTVGNQFQITLSNTIALNSIPNLAPSKASVFDLDLFETNKDTIQALQNEGKKVICYFSAGTVEKWRPDFHSFQQADLFGGMIDWHDEFWLNITSPSILDIMKRRIRMAKDKGCDGIDPDNMDIYANKEEAKISFTPEEVKTYLAYLKDESHSLGMAIGLKNGVEIVSDPDVVNWIDFAVNEECAKFAGACKNYTNLIAAGKPVFHIEYVTHKTSGRAHTSSDVTIDCKDKTATTPVGSHLLSSMSSKDLKSFYCLNKYVDLGSTKPADFSTVIKVMDLDGWVLYCDGSEATTVLVEDKKDKKVKEKGC